jgi:YVTN family beta-propeller protein
MALSLLMAALGCTSLHAQRIAYVPNFFNNTVSVINTTTNTVTATIPVGEEPGAVVFLPDGSRAYVINRSSFGTGTFTVIDTASSTVVATVDVPNVMAPMFSAVAPDGKTLYIPSFQTQSVAVIDTATNTLRATIPVPVMGPTGTAVTPDGSRLYVCANSGSVVVFDTATNAQIGDPIPITVGGAFIDLKVTPDGKAVYVAAGFGTVVSKIDTATNTALSIPNVPASSGISISPDGASVYVPALFDGSLTIIDTATNTVHPGVVPLESGPGPSASTPDGAFLYVVNEDSNDVSVVDTASNTVVATVPVGGLPFAIAIPNSSGPLPPTAVAGPNQTITVGQTVHLDGSGSFAPDTLPANLQYAWSFSARPFFSLAVLNGANTATPSFVADAIGTYVVQLTVTDPATHLISALSQVTVSSVWSPPMANVAASAQSVTTGSVVNLNGLGSSDPNGLPLLTYFWSLISRPDGSGASVIPGDLGLASFTPDAAGSYTVQLVVSDRFGSSQPAFTFITATTLENSEQLLQDAINYIAAMPASHFDAPGHKNALTNHLQQAITDIQRHKISQAIGKIQDAIIRTDGFPLRGGLDGNGAGMDWIIDQNDQNLVYGKLTAALNLLEAM